MRPANLLASAQQSRAVLGYLAGVPWYAGIEAAGAREPRAFAGMNGGRGDG